MSSNFPKIFNFLVVLVVLQLSGCAVITGQATSLSITDNKIGTGKEAVKNSRVSIHYTGWIYDPRAEGNKGRHFDTTKGNKPFTFELGVGDTIKGWDKGIKGMRVGGRRTLVIPSDLAYGSEGKGRKIPGGAVLVYVIDLEDIDGEKSGFVLRDDKIGAGTVATRHSKVSVHYTGWLYDERAKGFKGKQFDSSVGSKPFEFMLGRGRVIAGWDAGVRGMKVGGHRTLIIPPELAYGDRGAGNAVPPGAKLIFNVELLKVYY